MAPKPNGEPTIQCHLCNLAPLCLPQGLPDESVTRLDHIIRRTRPLEPGERLVHRNDPFLSVFAVRSGGCKASVPVGEETERIVGFHLPSELVGLEAMAEGSYPASVEALERTAVCELPIPHLNADNDPDGRIRQRLLTYMSRELSALAHRHAYFCGYNAAQRLSAFLLDMTDRLQQSAGSRRIRISQRNISNYLGLAEETVSRTLSRMEARGLIRCPERTLEVADRTTLTQIRDTGKLPSADTAPH